MPDSTHEDDASQLRTELDQPGKRTDRRGLFKTAGATAIGAALVGLVDATPAGAADGGPVLLGQSNSANDVTSITSAGGFSSENTADFNAGVYGSDVSSKSGYGVYGLSENGICVYGSPFGNTSGLLGSTIGAVVGDSDGSIGVLGLSTSNDGVHGETTHGANSGVAGIDTSTSGGHGAYGRSTNGIGVFGTLASGPSGLLGGGSMAGVVGDSGSARGVLGLSAGDDGVHGTTSADGFSGVRGVDTSAGGGYGVYGSSTAGTALKVVGITEFSRSGSALVSGASVVVTGVALSSSSLILATLQGYEKGVAVAGVVPNVATSSFTIHLTKAAKVSLAIAWFVVG
jgi:hypothetical protein